MSAIHAIERTRSAVRSRAKLTAKLTTWLTLVAVLFASPIASAAGRDRTKPTIPGNFRVTNKTPFSISLAWSPSQDNSGSFTYLVWSTGGGGPVTLPQTATTHTFSPPFYPGNSYTLGIQAVDAAGNYSNPLSISTTTPADSTPPSTSPVVSLTDVGSTYLSLAWTAAEDDGPFLFYRVAVNGVPYATKISNLSTTVRFLQPETSYTITVQATDYGNNAAPLSAPLSVTTEAPNPADHTAPSTPTNLREDHWGGGDTEIHVAWDQSTDDFDLPVNLRYDVYVNGVFQDVLFGSGGPSIVYGDLGDNTIEVVATDTAGNASTPGVIHVGF